MGYLDFLRAQWLGFKSQWPRNCHSGTSALLYWSGSHWIQIEEGLCYILHLSLFFFLLSLSNSRTCHDLGFT